MKVGDLVKYDSTNDLFQWDGEIGIIIEFKNTFCSGGGAIASSSLVTTLVKGRTIEEASSIKNIDIAKELALPPVKIHCSVLAEDAIKAAIEDYRKKNE